MSFLSGATNCALRRYSVQWCPIDHDRRLFIRPLPQNHCLVCGHIPIAIAIDRDVHNARSTSYGVRLLPKPCSCVRVWGGWGSYIFNSICVCAFCMVSSRTRICLCHNQILASTVDGEVDILTVWWTEKFLVDWLICYGRRHQRQMTRVSNK